jgi:DNA-binding GntR family transcriptional regulator
VVIDHDSATPLYLQVSDLLRQQIESGALTACLPSVKSLSQEHGISQITAEKALAVLRDEGIIHSVIGKGYYGWSRRRSQSPGGLRIPPTLGCRGHTRR